MGGRQMKYKEHTAFMIDFITSFVNGEIDRYFFDLDYSGYVIEHFPYMEFEDARLAERFADTVDRAYERGTALGLSDEEFRLEISNALDKWLGRKHLNIT
jgi:predicted ATPase